MIHWTRQIKAVLSAQPVSDIGDTSGLLEEISFWKSRCADLDSISKQLQKPGVCHIQAILQLYTSSYIPPFCKLAKQIQVQLSIYMCVCVCVCVCVCLWVCENMCGATWQELSRGVMGWTRTFSGCWWFICGFWTASPHPSQMRPSHMRALLLWVGLASHFNGRWSMSVSSTSALSVAPSLPLNTDFGSVYGCSYNDSRLGFR